MIEVRHSQFPVVPRRKLLQGVKQNHRIQSAGNRDEDFVALFDQVAGLNLIFYVLEQIGHKAMLLHPQIGARRRNHCAALMR
jgi:hypothetical protein